MMRRTNSHHREQTYLARRFDDESNNAENVQRIFAAYNNRTVGAIHWDELDCRA